MKLLICHVVEDDDARGRGRCGSSTWAQEVDKQLWTWAIYFARVNVNTEHVYLSCVMAWLNQFLSFFSITTITLKYRKTISLMGSSSVGDSMRRTRRDATRHDTTKTKLMEVNCVHHCSIKVNEGQSYCKWQMRCIERNTIAVFHVTDDDLSVTLYSCSWLFYFTFLFLIYC